MGILAIFHRWIQITKNRRKSTVLYWSHDYFSYLWCQILIALPAHWHYSCLNQLHSILFLVKIFSQLAPRPVQSFRCNLYSRPVQSESRNFFLCVCPYYSRSPPTRSISKDNIYSWSLQLNVKLMLLPHCGKTDYWPMTSPPKDLTNEYFIFYPDLLEYVGL